MENKLITAESVSAAGILERIAGYAPGTPEANFARLMIGGCDAEFLERGEDAYLKSRLEEMVRFFFETLEKDFAATVCECEVEEGSSVRLLSIGTSMNDRPFIFSSVMEFLEEAGMRIVNLSHPIFSVSKKDGRPVEVEAGKAGLRGQRSFAWIAAEVTGGKSAAEIESGLMEVLSKLAQVDDDLEEIRMAMRALAAERDDQEAEDIRFSEGRQLFQWMLRGNVFLLGSARISSRQAKLRCEPEDFGNPLGIMKPLPGEKHDAEFFREIEGGIKQFMGVPQIFSLMEINKKSPIYGRAKIIMGLHKSREKDGTRSIHLFPLLFTQSALRFAPTEIPLARLKVDGALDRAEITRYSHDFREAIRFFNEFPTSEIFRMERNELTFLLTNVQQRFWKFRKVESFFYHQPQRQYLHVTVVIPEERHYPESLRKISEKFAEYLKVDPNYMYQFEISGRVLQHFVYWGDTLGGVSVDLKMLQRIIGGMFVRWQDRLESLLCEQGEREALEAVRPCGAFRNGFSDKYKYVNKPDDARRDLSFLIKCRMERRLVCDFANQSETRSHLTVFDLCPVPMRKVLNVLENCGLQVENYDEYEVRSEPPQFISRYNLSHPPVRGDDEQFAARYLEVLDFLIRSDEEMDRIYGLAAFPGMYCSSISVLKIYREYFSQVIPRFGQGTLNDVLLENPKVSRLLKEYFLRKFNLDQPARVADESGLEGLKRELADEINLVTGLSADFALRVFMSLIGATLRTNYFRSERDALAIKIDCASSEYIPGPKLKYEIFISGGVLSGIHLRGGDIARGGLRFSDRPDDFRAEVLGLARAQMLKNAVIVPEGSKGGFVVKKKWANRGEMFEDSKIHYRRYIRALLSVTDNVLDGKVEPPPQTICYDGEDPYLVVAADKGTATFSDLANEISEERGFWLSDAFASGGSSGYGHKSLAITAKGAWECVKLHFLELGVNIDNETFTVVGIGDMSGDVFGNGMLLSRNIKLLAAFNHIHIFIDPNPEPAVSFNERERLFGLPSSTWKDYDPALISPGGGVFERTAKRIELSPEMKKMLGTQADSLSGVELIRDLLRLKVDLLWNGGIGTYVKARNETHLDAGDSHNDEVRVDAGEVRAAIIGEGGNLGVTPKGRSEYNLNGGLINADSIDNSAGVNLSDHEVNVKILCNELIRAGRISSDERDGLLASLSEEMVELCIRDNVSCGVMISMDQQRFHENPGYFVAEIEHLEKTMGLNREEDTIPTDEELGLLHQEQKSIPRPTLSVLSAYTKNYVQSKILDSGIPELDACQKYFTEYFPASLGKRHDLKTVEHRLRREIVATRISNYFVNRCGVSYISELANMTRRRSHEIVLGFMIADDVFDGGQIGEWLLGDGCGLHPNLLELAQLLTDLLRREEIWLLNTYPAGEFNHDLAAKYRQSVCEIRAELLGELGEEEHRRLSEYLGHGSNNENRPSPEALVPLLISKNYLELANLKLRFGFNLKEAECLLENTNGLFSFRETQNRLLSFKTSSVWEINHLGLLNIRLNQVKKKIYRKIMCEGKGQHPENCLKRFVEENREALANFSKIRGRFLTEEVKLISAAESLMFQLESDF